MENQRLGTVAENWSKAPRIAQLAIQDETLPAHVNQTLSISKAVRLCPEAKKPQRLT